MLTNSIEYKELKNRIALFLNVDINSICSIVNPMRKKKTTVNIWLITFGNNIRSIMIRDINGMFIKIN